MKTRLLLTLLAVVLFRTTGCSVFVPVYVVNHADTAVTLTVGFREVSETTIRARSSDRVSVAMVEANASMVRDIKHWQDADARWIDSTTMQVTIPPHSTVFAATTINWHGRLRVLEIDGCDLRVDTVCARIEHPSGWFPGFHVVLHVGEQQQADVQMFKDKATTEAWLQDNQVPALGVGYINEGRIEEIQVYGELEAGRPAPTSTIWNVASLTKPVTALVALRLVDAGLLQLDEPVDRYWVDPDLDSDPRAHTITLRHLLSHQSGLPNWRGASTSKKLSIEFDPGSRYQYSGEGYEYIRRVIEQRTGSTLDQLADSLIFTPLHMTSTRFTWDSTVDEARFAKWHDTTGALYATYKNTATNAADDLLTTVADYTTFLHHVLQGAGLSRELYAQMMSEQVRIGPRKYWGLGWWIDENVGSAHKALLMGGDDKGVHTLAIMLPDSQQALLIFTNCDNGTDLYIPIVRAYLGSIGQGIIEVETKQ